MAKKIKKKKKFTFLYANCEQMIQSDTKAECFVCEKKKKENTQKWKIILMRIDDFAVNDILCNFFNNESVLCCLMEWK
jgi:hypothetical protein